MFHLLANPSIIPVLREDIEEIVSREGWTKAWRGASKCVWPAGQFRIFVYYLVALHRMDCVQAILFLVFLTPSFVYRMAFVRVSSRVSYSHDVVMNLFVCVHTHPLTLVTNEHIVLIIFMYLRDWTGLVQTSFFVRRGGSVNSLAPYVQ